MFVQFKSVYVYVFSKKKSRCDRVLRDVSLILESHSRTFMFNGLFIIIVVSVFSSSRFPFDWYSYIIQYQRLSKNQLNGNFNTLSYRSHVQITQYVLNVMYRAILKFHQVDFPKLSTGSFDRVYCKQLIVKCWHLCSVENCLKIVIITIFARHV